MISPSDIFYPARPEFYVESGFAQGPFVPKLDCERTTRWQRKVTCMSLRVCQSGSISVFHRTIIFGLLFSLNLPASSFGDEPAETIGTDVILHEQGMLQGSVLDEAGRPIASAEVRILKSSRVVAVVTTDEAGRFWIRSLRNGTHVLQTDGAMQIVRFWGKSAAPPSAVDNLTVVVRPDPLVRGQAASLPGVMGNPWFIAGVVGVAVGTVLIVDHENDDDNRAAPRLASP